MAKNKGGNFKWDNNKVASQLIVILHDQGVAQNCRKFDHFFQTDDYAATELRANPFIEAHRYDRDADLWHKANRWYDSSKIVWEACASTSVPKTVRMATLIAG